MYVAMIIHALNPRFPALQCGKTSNNNQYKLDNLLALNKEKLSSVSIINCKITLNVIQFLANKTV